MKSETKLFLGILLGTIAIVAVGVALLSRSAAPVKVDSSRLIHEDSHKIASGSGTLTLVEFSDFQCPACGAYYAPVKQLVNEFASQMTFVYRNFPLTTVHKNAQTAAQAAEAAGVQGKFWEMHDKLFETQPEWSGSDTPVDIFAGYAKDLGLNVDAFKKDIDSDAVKNKVAKDVEDANALGINATPTFFLDGVKLDNPASFADFESLIKAEIAKAPKPTTTKAEEYHIHANFKVYENGVALDFSQYKEEDPSIHIHDAKGDLLHIHKQGIPLSQFFASIKLNISGTMKLYVNGKENSQGLMYIPMDLDKILLTDATDPATIQQQLASVTDDACIYSLKCPARGTPPTEKCVGGLGTDCKD